jgi:hypothetical protein
MRWLEVRRHSLTKKGSARDRGSHLSADGVALAPLVGEPLGFAVDDTVELPWGHVSGEVDHHDQWRWPRPHRSYAELIGRGGGLASVAETHRRIWTSVVAAVPDGAAALVVGHGGGIEQGLVACLPDADHEWWGAPFGPCDGAGHSVGLSPPITGRRILGL